MYAVRDGGIKILLPLDNLVCRMVRMNLMQFCHSRITDES